MRRVDFFTGETPIEVISPPVSQEEQMANLGQYQYGGGGPPVNIGGIGYNNYQGAPYQQQGIGYNYGGWPPPEYTQYGYNPQAYQQQQYCPNPAFAMMGNNAPVQAQDVTVEIPPFNPWGSDYLYNDNLEQEVLKLQWKCLWDEETAQIQKQTMYPNQQYGNTNYYGNQYYTNPYYNNRKLVEEYNKIKDTARQSRINMNINLSKLAHNYLGDDISEETIVEMYTGKTVTVEGITNLDIYEDNKLRNLIPFDNSQFYRDADARVSAEFRKRISPDANMNECFENLALVEFDYALEKERHRRNKEFGSNYDSNTYKTLIREKVHNDLNKKVSDTEKQVREMRDNLLGSGMFPTLSQSAHLSDDGTLNITYSYNAEDINNLNETEYQQERERFNSFLNSIPNVLGGIDSG